VDRWIWWTTTGCVGLLALVAGTVSCLHIHQLVELHGQPGWVAALTPLSVDGMIVAASTMLADSRTGQRGGVLPRALLVIGSAASLAANVAVAERTVTGRIIAAWPSFALIGAYELLMRQVRRHAASAGKPHQRTPVPQVLRQEAAGEAAPGLRHRSSGSDRGRSRSGQIAAGRDLGQQAWRWALAHRDSDGALPSGLEIARQHGRHERWGRLVKRAGTAGEFAIEPGLRLIDQRPPPAQGR
jgi:Protein of unknown function (DUF2637)